MEKRYKNLDYSTPNELFKELNKALDATAATILKFLDVYSRKTGTDYDNVTKKYNTELDEKQMTLQKEDIVRFITDRNSIIFRTCVQFLRSTCKATFIN